MRLDTAATQLSLENLRRLWNCSYAKYKQRQTAEENKTWIASSMKNEGKEQTFKVRVLRVDIAPHIRTLIKTCARK